ncbi:uncharacterized protein CBO05P1_115 [Clostridium botulinum B str. Osaka05]|uniref:Uncharacterized protein n=1 Tax=Clostridium botulinum B str. Osaka05 TaxID=1407017 RepID=A0A060N9H0_CLOBO|nr:hypothetical protein [Clostridium botulinum]BAO04834.1 uncharacterized protein CBO05P1_115 [Clostridium botulinum B str. Osaka05]
MKHKIKITETYVYYIDIEASSEKKALEKAREYYETTEDGITGVADANSFEKVKFKINED